MQRTQTAIVGNSEGGVELSHNVSVPEVKDDIVLIRSIAVSVNPVDTKMSGSYVTPGAIAGCDVAGYVEEVGPDAARQGIEVGSRVSAIVMGMNPLEPLHGAFAEHVAARPAVGFLRLPDSMSFERGCALGTSFMTAGLALFKSLGLPGHPLEPNTKGIQVLVYGGSTATGTAAIQLLRLAGFTPLATCSPQNAAMAKSYGAEAVFDYRQADCAAQIRAHTRNGLRFALDTITTTESMQICYGALGRVGGRYTALDPYAHTVAAARKMVKADWVMGPVMLGKDIAWPAPHDRAADPEMFDFGTKWRATLQELLDQGKLREHPLLLQPGGLEGVLDGMEMIKAKKISGKKLVYTMSA
ncbi:putative secondary metabolism biosynthetic enzyme [Diaporthe australafricana]|uniref:Secondary metabolism biosynthetic enzyme n=1 Tax=Diaporthe australafricana TaxID=127596 RepID=A0ABR3XHF7_9PEZI